jgi:N6-adenosine-specific RNA methylase IME4
MIMAHTDDDIEGYKLEILEELKELIPPLQECEFEQLESNILEAGEIRDPLIIYRMAYNDYENDDCMDRYILLDGHNRHAIAKKNGLQYKWVFCPENISSLADAKQWIIKNQFGRRNLSAYDRATLALRLKDIWATQAKENQRRRAEKMNYEKWHSSENLSSSPNSENLIKQSKHIDIYKEIGKTANLSHNTIAQVQKIESTVIPEIRDKVRRGDISINDAYKVVNMPEAEQQKIATKMDESGMDKLADAIREVKRVEIIENLESISVQETKKTQGFYDVIVIDPPWPMEKIEREVAPSQALLDYPTMALEEIAAMQIPGAPDCHLWLWCTHKLLPRAFNILEMWNYKYVCAFVWHKPGGFQPYGLPQYNCEFALYARQGSPPFIDLKDFPVCFSAPRNAHSEKPKEFYDLVRRVTAGRRLDMFARRAIEGFDSWGNEAK